MAKKKSGFSKTNKGNSKYSLPPSRNRHLQQEEQEAITKFHDVDNEFEYVFILKCNKNICVYY